MNLASKYQGIVVTKKQEYSCVQKILCCKCFACCQEQKVMTSDIRKETFQRMMEDYLVKDNDQVLLDPVKLMILIYVCNDDHIPAKHIQRCKINPSTGVINYRTDLEFYLPQLCNYIVFYRSLENNYLKEALQKMSKLNFYFAHLYYFYMKSLQKNITKEEVQVIRPVVDYNRWFRTELGGHYKDIELTCLDLFMQDKSNKPSYQSDEFMKNVIFDYESKKVEYGKLLKSTKVSISDVNPKKYSSIFDGEHDQINSSFESTLLLFQDLFYICNQLTTAQNKQERAQQLIKMINEHLPSNAYIPLSKNCYRICNILKIVVNQIRIFSTKQRAPMCLCIETYCPADCLEKQEEEKFWTNVEVPMTLKMMTFKNRGSYFAQNYQKTAEFKKYRQSSLQLKKLGEITNLMVQQRIKQIHFNEYLPAKSQRKLTQQQISQHKYPPSIDTEMISVKLDQHLLETLPQEKLEKMNAKDQPSQANKKQGLKELRGYNQNTKKFYHKEFEAMFGQPLLHAKKRISNNSIFGNLKSWDIIYIILKTNDDLKQEQFAMQLIHQFDYIFKLEKLPLILTTYQVLSMGPDRGIIEMVKDSVTFDKLQKTLQRSFPSKISLRSFFQIYFGDNVMQAKVNFLKSLAAYCVVMYIIQAKDRHNGNILLHRNGKIFHIDFGFFLSNMPGKGIQLEKDCPFKLLSEYVQVLDGIDSYYFKKFRQYFFLGFKAIKKHQNKVLMLVKLMYSTSGMTMPCFTKGEAAITAMEQRINPPGITNDSLLNEHCQQLINLSLDNWAAKWYDRFQYWAQGIFY